jgi:type I restriction enzyme, R subunit
VSGAAVRARSEGAFEDAVTGALLASGWRPGQVGDYDPGLGLDTAHLWEFVGATQPDVLDTLTAYTAGDIDTAMGEFKRLVAKEVDSRGVLDVLRNGVKDRGVRVELAYFRPAHTVAEDALDNYRRNRLSVTRQLRYSAQRGNALDLTLFVNGLPVATAELKSSASEHPQTVKDAIRQYREILRLDPELPDIWLNLGIVYAISGQTDQARRAWEAALRLDPGHQAARLYLARLAQEED